MSATRITDDSFLDSEIADKWYKDGDMHTMYVGQIIDVLTLLDASPYTNKGTNIVQLANFGDSSINILVSAYLLTNVYAEFLQMQNDLNLNIMDIMQADGVDFAFPSTSVYIEKNGAPRILSKAALATAAKIPSDSSTG